MLGCQRQATLEKASAGRQGWPAPPLAAQPEPSTHAATPRAGPAGQECPGEPVSAASPCLHPSPGVHSTAAGTPHPYLPPWSSRPSQLGSGRACPGTLLASAPAQLAPLAGRYVMCFALPCHASRQNAEVRPWQRHCGDKGIRCSRDKGTPDTLHPPRMVHREHSWQAMTAQEPLQFLNISALACCKCPVPGKVTTPSYLAW